MTAPRARLSKRHVESLLRDYDDDPVGALTVALRLVLDRPQAGWEELLDASGIDPDRRRALADRDTAALDVLLRDLNEQRGSSF